MNRWWALLVVASLVSMAACEQASEEPAPGSDDELAIDDLGDVPDVEGERAALGAGIRRMTLRELDASIRVAAGTDAAGEAIYWNVKAGVPFSALDHRAYGEVLGLPDWVSITEEATTPNPLYTKFVQDMSRDVCVQMVTSDATKPSGEEKTLFRYAPIDQEPTAEERDENLRYLLLRFLGLEGDEAEPRREALASLYDTIATIAADNDQDQPWVNGWSVVCFALFEDPAFHLH